ncbi:S-layer homology domain-containing protein [Paenarthrobacter nicotinovorans]|uniref:S-layer homology domain-containing protein n=1 Tax=Paenarthrobacter nicotinovorans TaxID=29320 RepID=UPI00382F7CE8
MFRRGVAWLVAVVVVVVPGLMVAPAAVAADPVVENVVVFSDVPESSQFATEISWLAASGISTGWDAGAGVRQYRPSESIARDAMAAFLYRHAGSPAFTPPASSPFTDVPAGAAFYKEITWLASTGISTGWDVGGGKREYRPLSPIARDAMAAFLYRYAGKPGFTAPAVSPFTDVPAGGGFYTEITWLADAGISTGWAGAGGLKEYRPLTGIARDAMAAFLYRYAGQKTPADPTNPAAGTVTIAPDVEVLEPAQVQSALVSGDTVVLPSDQATDIKANDVLVSGATTGTPNGLLARVVQVVRDPAGNTLVKTKPATLPEAVVSTGGLLEVTGTPVSSEFIPEPDVTIDPAPASAGPDLAHPLNQARPYATATADVYSRSFSWKKTFKSEAKSPNLTGTGSLAIESSIKTSAKAKMTLETGFLSLKEASVVLTPSTSASHSIKVAGNLVGKISAPLGELNSAFTFMAGPVPVVVTTQLAVSANLTVDGTAEIALISSQTVSSDHGFRYKDGSFNLINTKPSSHGVENTVKASASLTAEASLDFDATVKLYGIAGITFGAGPYVSAAIKVTSSQEGPQWSCPIELGFAARLGLKAGINIMGINLGEWTDTTTTGWTLDVANPCEGKPVVAPDPLPEPTPTPTPTPAPEPGEGAVDLVNLTPGGTTGVDQPTIPAVSADGRFVAFVSASADLAHGIDVNGAEDVFVKDMQTGVTRLVSATASGGSGNGKSGEPSISADGRYVAFSSRATDLVPEDSSRLTDVFVRDMVTGTTKLVSGTPAGTAGDGNSIGPSISGDGQAIAFTSTAKNLVDGSANGSSDVFVRDMTTQTTRLVSVTTAGVVGNGWSSDASISADGNFVAFSSFSDNLAAGDSAAAYSDVFVRDLMRGTTKLVSATPSGSVANDASYVPSISGDGRFVAFSSYASDLDTDEPTEARGTNDVFVRDTETGTTQLVSVNPKSGQSNDWSHSPDISSDGRFVSYISTGLNMVTGATTTAEDVYVRDMRTGSTRLATVTASGEPVDEWFIQQSISDDARYVVFSSFGTDFLPAGQPAGLGIFRVKVLP